MSPIYTIQVNLTQLNSSVAISGIAATNTSVIATVMLAGPAGAGVPTGGATGKVLTKLSGADNDTAWSSTNINGLLQSGSHIYMSGSGTSGSPYVINSSGSSYYNIKDYGALVDGTTDDTVAIQAVINLVSTAGGGTVFFPAGTTVVTSLTLKSNVNFIGVASGWDTATGSVIKTTATSGDTLSYSSSATGLKDVCIEDLRIEGPASGSGSGIRLQNAGGTSKPNLRIILRNLKVVGFGAAGIEAACIITSTFDNVVCETCATGFYLNGGVSYASVNTSLTLQNCYANGCATYGFRILSTVYSSLTATAADDCGTAYYIDTCNNISLQAPGCEWGNPTSASPADGYKITGASHNIVLSAPYTFQNKHYSFWITGNSTGVVLISPAENTALSATASLKTDAGSYTTVIGQDFTTAVSTAGVTSYLNDGTGGITIPGASYLGSTLEVVGAVQFDGAVKVPSYGGLYNSTAKVLELGSYGTPPVNYIGIEAAPAGTAADIYAGGTDTNIDFAVTPKGTGRLKSGGVTVPTISSTDTLTGKTMAAGSNTITGLAVANLGGITGTPSSSNYLRGDGTWATVAGGTGITRSISSISAPATAGATASTDYVYFVSGTTTLTLPTAVSNTNRYTVKNVGVATVTIATTSSQTIDGSSTITLPVSNTSVDLISNNANWRVV